MTRYCAFDERGSRPASRERAECTFSPSGQPSRRWTCIAGSMPMSNACGALPKAQAIATVQLAAMVLAKRAFSSASPLAISAQRRLAGLTPTDSVPAQGALPFSDDHLEDDAPVPTLAAFDVLADERAALQGVIDASLRAQPSDAKLRVLQRLLRRVREPAIVFTEYRDTLETIGHALRSERADHHLAWGPHT